MFGRIVIILLLYLVKFRRCYEIPEVSFERLPLGGIRVSIPDEPGVQFFAFHANVNDRIGTNEVGTITGEVIRSRDNRWTFEDRKVSFRENDVLYYWVYVQANGIPYTRSGQEGIAINDRVSKGGISECKKSITSVRGKVAACRGHLVFEETFDREMDGEDSSTAKTSSWTREIIVPMDPDYEFCMYRELPNNLQFNNGTLAIVPLILDEVHGGNATFFGRLDLSESCTGSVPLECNRQAIGHSILPPVISARLTTKESFHFRYGKIEIRAKFPQGDWLYPEIWLEPRHHSYGAGYSSGRIMLGLARGNEHLASTSSTDTVQYGGRLLEFGLRTGPRKEVRENKVTKMRSLGRWSDDFHVYTTIWDEGGFRFRVDGEDVGRIEVGAWSDQNRKAKNSTGTNDSMAPYDQEFYITAGLGVGGIRVFPDGTSSGRNPKPWRNVEAKAMLNFWLAKEKWLPSWRGRNGNGNSQFKLDYIRVWAV